MRAQLRALFLLRLSVGFRVSPRPCDYSIQRSASSATVEEPIAMTANLILAAIQMTSTNDKAANLHSTICLVERAAHRGAYFIALPECSSFIGGGNFADSLVETHPRDAIAASETLDGPYMQALCQLATRLNVWLSVGGFPESINKDEEICSKLTLQPSPTKVFNTHVLISPAGTITEKYRKIHLFDSPLAGLMESKSTVAGSSLAVADCLFARVGLTTCYDLRFPELYGALCRPLRSDSENQAVDISGYGLGAEIVLVPSAFTVATGTAHWEVLLRARAIENQCYVIAAAQIGTKEPYFHLVPLFSKMNPMKTFTLINSFDRVFFLLYIRSA